MKDRTQIQKFLVHKMVETVFRSRPTLNHVMYYIKENNLHDCPQYAIVPLETW